MVGPPARPILIVLRVLWVRQQWSAFVGVGPLGVSVPTVRVDGRIDKNHRVFEVVDHLRVVRTRQGISGQQGGF